MFQSVHLLFYTTPAKKGGNWEQNTSSCKKYCLTLKIGHFMTCPPLFFPGKVIQTFTSAIRPPSFGDAPPLVIHLTLLVTSLGLLPIASGATVDPSNWIILPQGWTSKNSWISPTQMMIVNYIYIYCTSLFSRFVFTIMKYDTYITNIMIQWYTVVKENNRSPFWRTDGLDRKVASTVSFYLWSPMRLLSVTQISGCPTFWKHETSWNIQNWSFSKYLWMISLL